MNTMLADATVPTIYHRAYAAVDPNGTGETSVNALSRVLTTSSLPASTIDRVWPRRPRNALRLINLL